MPSFATIFPEIASVVPDIPEIPIAIATVAGEIPSIPANVTPVARDLASALVIPNILLQVSAVLP